MFRLRTTARIGTISALKQPPTAKQATNWEYPKTRVTIFHKFVLFWGLATHAGKRVSDGEAVR